MLKRDAWTNRGVWGRLAAAAGALLVLLLAGPALAQVADGVIEVVVLDETGARLPGVTVTVKKPDTGFERVMTTAGNGTARVPALPPGTYEVRFDLQGFASAVREDVVLRVGQTARLEPSLNLAGVTETVTVTGEAPMVDVFKTDSSTNIVPEQIMELPVQDRDFQKLAFITPGVQRERGTFRFVQGGPVIGSGGNASLSTILVDGVDLTDPTLGLARVRFSQDAISEFRVIANRFDTEIGGSSGGALSIVTKSGTNDFHGSAFGFFRRKGLRSKGEFELEKVDFSRDQFGFTLGGPFAEDKTHFFLSFEQINEDSFTLFRPGGAFVDLAEDIKVPLNQTLGYAGLNHQINDRQQMRAKFVYERYRQENFRVGGVNDVSNGQQLNRDNWNVTLTHNWNVSSDALNTLNFQIGGRKYDEPTNSLRLNEWFSSGSTLVTGTNLVGNLLGDATQWEIRDTFFLHASQGDMSHDLKFGFAWQHVKDRFFFPVWETGSLLYATDTRALPILLIYGEGSGDATITTDILSGFVQDDFRPSPNVSLSLGLRYDLDTNANNPDFTHLLRPTARGRDTSRFQPRLGFSWDLKSDGSHVLRGGVGIFSGRYLLVPAFSEQQQNGETGRVTRQNLNGLLLGLPPQFWLDPNDPFNTGLPLPIDITLLDETYDAPRSTQVTLGYTVRLGDSGLFFDIEGIYAKGTDEQIVRDANWAGNDSILAGERPRPNPSYNQINTYTNEGHSKYKALVASVNGLLAGKHQIAASFTLADKKNINDDFSPALVDYPSDPADIEAEFSRSRADERYRFIVSGVFQLPADFTIAPIYEYGSGQPWNRRLGYDFNGDGKTSDRAAGVPAFSEDGPSLSQFSLRLTKKFRFGESTSLDLIAEAFNLFNRVNEDVNSIDGAEFLTGPTLLNPGIPTVPNSRFGEATDSLSPREIQLGVRLVF